MTAPHDIDPQALLSDLLTQASPDLMRQMLTTFINALLSAEADSVCGAAYGARSDERGMIKSCGWSPGAGVRGTHLLGDDLSVTEILIMGRRWKRWSGKVRPCPM